MTSSLIAKALVRSAPRVASDTRPDEERIGQLYDARRRWLRRLMRWGLVAVVVAPTLVSAVYYGLWAAPRYVSETQFIVRGIHGAGAAPGLEGLLQALGVARSTDDSNAVLDYLVSRDAVAGLEAALPLRKIYGRDEADALARFPHPFMGDSFERLYWYYSSRATVYPDTDTGIITIQAQAFRPDDAQAIARQLLTQAEALVNAMNARLETDTVSSAKTAVAEATKVVLATQEEVTRFRNSEVVVDPSENAVAQLSTITDLSGEVDEVLAQIAQNKKVSPANPAVSALKAKADALAAQIAAEEKTLAGSREAVADKVSAYERLMLLRSLADASLAAATASLDSARDDARRQHVFVEEIVAPNLPDEPTEPQRLRAVGTVFAVSMAALAVLWLVSVGVKEHRN
jgi:capsular polysaccharide transport system permease protein